MSFTGVILLRIFYSVEILITLTLAARLPAEDASLATNCIRHPAIKDDDETTIASMAVCHRLRVLERKRV
ncbi:hypothetical protein Y032_0011g1247 [Ancylostoma ceylanicum]|uniref:Secreted protein n=1 Tax=Ancylostoma ceylanicum TaxID=53326 RepID=A0A016VER8_9BILA|nr:hypothetical protein Y032_0011g1247 [Ancylostoma ceylanicum]